MNDDEKVVEALKTLQRCCKAHASCAMCPLSADGDDCGITYLEPDNWKINEPGAVWRAVL